MIETLKTRKEELEKRGKKGFTLMEMLIVIAIIAILIAIAIPIFTSQLARANAETDAANIRSGYAQVQSDLMLSNVKEDTTYTLCADGTVYKGNTVPDGKQNYVTKGNKSDAADKDTFTIGGVPNANIEWSAGQIVKYQVEYSATTGPVVAGIESEAGAANQNG